MLVAVRSFQQERRTYYHMIVVVLCPIGTLLASFQRQRQAAPIVSHHDNIGLRMRIVCCIVALIFLPSRPCVHALTMRSAVLAMAQHSCWRPPTLGSSFVPTYRLLKPTRRIASATSIVMMPEGPEVRTLVQQMQEGGVGQRLVQWQFLSGRYVRHGRPKGWDEFRATMTQLSDENSNEKIDRVLEWKAKGKFIYMLLDRGGRAPPDEDDDDFARSIWITLGMSGRFVNQAVHEAGTRQQQKMARWYLELHNDETGKRTRIYYYDNRNFGTLRFCLSRSELAAKLESLGPDILDTTDTTVAVFRQIVAATKPTTNVCRFLMDQSKISGVGNYILSEGLYRASIDPFCTLADLDKEQEERLFTELQKVAVESFGAQGMTRQGGQYRTYEGIQGEYAFELQCYGRDYAANGEVVYKQLNGPHGRTIWYTKEQLFPPRTLEGVPTENISMTIGNAHNAGTSSSQSFDPVEALSNQLTDPLWKLALSSAMATEGFAQLAQFVQEERRVHEIYPPPEQVFNAFNLCPLDKVKVVIVGQDPYHGPGQGHGLAFSVRVGVKPPPSLVNIFKEAANDVGIPFPPPHGNLKAWAQQGVLLLNTVLTVRRGQANSHAGKGWEEFTDAVIDLLNQRDHRGLVFLLWGQPAQRKAASVDESKHFVIRTSHPSPLGATKTSTPFLGSRCFSRANKCLEQQMNQTPIDWRVL